MGPVLFNNIFHFLLSHLLCYLLPIFFYLHHCYVLNINCKFMLPIYENTLKLIERTFQHMGILWGCRLGNLIGQKCGSHVFWSWQLNYVWKERALLISEQITQQDGGGEQLFFPVLLSVFMETSYNKEYVL